MSLGSTIFRSEVSLRVSYMASLLNVPRDGLESMLGMAGLLLLG